MSDAQDMDHIQELLKEMSMVFEGEEMADILCAISLFLSFSVHKLEPQEGTYVLMQVVSRAAEMAFGITAEVVTEGELH
jgi:hypothetical protein